MTDGEPAPASSVDAALAIIRTLPPSDIFGFNIALAETSATARIDNTPADGVPVVPPGNSQALVASLRGAFGNGPDMNPAHIIRECLTNRDWGLGYSGAEIGPSFTTAADTLYTEGFGLSLIWQQDVVHRGVHRQCARSHRRPRSSSTGAAGRWELRLIRADYVASSLPLFDETNVVDWGRLGRRTPGDLVNSVTVRFTDAWTDDTGAVSVTDTARVQAMGEVLATTLDYPGIRYQGLAVRVAERDLRALSAPLLTGEIVVNREGASLGPGDVIRLRSSRVGLEDVVMRLSEIGQGDGRDNGIRLKLVEDVFALGATAIAGGRMPSGGGVTHPARGAHPAHGRGSAVLAPRPRAWPQRTRTAACAEDPDAGALVATGERPSADALAAQLWIDPGTGPTQEGVVAFRPYGVYWPRTCPDGPEATRPSRSPAGATSARSRSARWPAIDGELVRGGRDHAHQASPSAEAVSIPSRAGVLAGTSVHLLRRGWRGSPRTAGRLARRSRLGLLPRDRARHAGFRPRPRGLRDAGPPRHPPCRPGGCKGTAATPPTSMHCSPDRCPDLDASRSADPARPRDRRSHRSLHRARTGGQLHRRGALGGSRYRAGRPARGVVIDAGTATSWTFAPEAIPELGAPDRTAEIELAVRSRRLVGGTWLTDREARRFRLTAPFAAGWDRRLGLPLGHLISASLPRTDRNARPSIPERIMPGLGLRAFYDPGQRNWGTSLSEDLRHSLRWCSRAPRRGP